MADIISLAEFAHDAALPLVTRGIGTYSQKLKIFGNSLLSTVFVKSMSPGSSLQVNYWDSGVAPQEGERFDLNAHTLIAAGDEPISNRIIVTRFHDKPVVEAIVSGGSVEFGVFISVVADFPVEGSVLDGQTANLGADKGSPVALYDPSDGKFYLWRSSEGVAQVEVLGTVTTTPDVVSSAVNTSVSLTNAFQEYSYALPVGTKQVSLKVRGPVKADIRLGWSVGSTAANWYTIPIGAEYNKENLDKDAAITVYLASETAGVIVEIESWS